MQLSTLFVFAVTLFGAATTALPNPSPQANGVSQARNAVLEARARSYGMCRGEACSSSKSCDEGLGCVCLNSQCVSGDNPQPPPNQPLPPVPQPHGQSTSGNSAKTASSSGKTNTFKTGSKTTPASSNQNVSKKGGRKST